MQLNIQNQINPTTFGKFFKISGKKNELDNFRNELKNNSYDFVSFIKNKSKKKSVLYIITGKDYDKFLDLMSEVPHFFDLRRYPENFLKKKPKSYSLKELKKRFKKNKVL